MHSRRAYSPKCLEGKFSELPLLGVLGSPQSPRATLYAPPACCASGEGTLYFAGGFRIISPVALRAGDVRASVSLRRGFFSR
jgi:hypothetical protein